VIVTTRKIIPNDCSHFDFFERLKESFIFWQKKRLWLDEWTQLIVAKAGDYYNLLFFSSAFPVAKTTAFSIYRADTTKYLTKKYFFHSFVMRSRNSSNQYKGRKPIWLLWQSWQRNLCNNKTIKAKRTQKVWLLEGNNSALSHHLQYIIH